MLFWSRDPTRFQWATPLSISLVVVVNHHKLKVQLMNHVWLWSVLLGHGKRAHVHVTMSSPRIELGIRVAALEGPVVDGHPTSAVHLRRLMVIHF